MISVVDYGAGNLRSVCNALAAIGAPFSVISDAAGVERASAILLPGVGHFAQMLQALDAAGMSETLRARLRAGTPYLGICLGMQALFETSEEAPGTPGLGLLSGSVRRFPASGRVPHMGWTTVKPLDEARLIPSGMYYFAHSYYVPVECPGGAAVAAHGFPFLAAVETANLAGCQFHPEKSGPRGLEFLERWVQRCRPSA